MNHVSVESVKKSVKMRHLKKNYGSNAARASYGFMEIVLDLIPVKYLKFLFAMPVCKLLLSYFTDC